MIKLCLQQLGKILKHERSRSTTDKRRRSKTSIWNAFSHIQFVFDVYLAAFTLSISALARGVENGK